MAGIPLKRLTGALGSRLPARPPAGEFRMFPDGTDTLQVMDSAGTVQPFNEWLGNRGMAAQDPGGVSILGGMGRFNTGLGYASDAVGSVSQTTSKSTSVTLDDVQTITLTMSAAALSADTVVSFTLNCNQIEASDALSTRHHSGGTIGAYLVNGRATGAGTASITIRNVTAGSLSEAVVLIISIEKRT